jgi:protease I
MKRCMLWSVVLMVVLSLTTVFAENKKEEKGGKLKGKKIVMIIAQIFEEPEFKYPKEIFDNEGANVTIASSTLSMAAGGNLRVKPDILIDDIKVKDFDAVVFIGGVGCAEYFDNPIAHKIAKQALEQGKILAAICLAPTILANAGLLQGKKATCFQPVNITSKGAIATGKEVERDGNIITGSGPSASAQFGEKIVLALSEK